MTVVAADLGIPTHLPATPADPRSTRTVGWFGATALLPMVAAHVVGASDVNPVLDPISWYAFVPGGGELILAGGVILAVLGLILTVRMYRAGLAVGPVPALAMIVFAIAMVLVGAFPTDPPGTAASLSAVIHRVSAAAAFCVLPLVGLSLERSIRQPQSSLPHGLRTAARALGVVVVLFLAVHMSLVYLADSGIMAFGLIERIGFLVMIGYLFLLAATIDREGSTERWQGVEPLRVDVGRFDATSGTETVPPRHDRGDRGGPALTEPGVVPSEQALVLSGSRSADLVG